MMKYLKEEFNTFCKDMAELWDVSRVATIISVFLVTLMVLIIAIFGIFLLAGLINLMISYPWTVLIFVGAPLFFYGITKMVVYQGRKR